MKDNQRIQALDGLRCVAILAVILFHYFSRWTSPAYSQNLYPYGNFLSQPFQYGSYGVELFFIISGYVIVLTLYRCSTFFEFAIRRFARLWPTMFISCLLTFTAVHIIPNQAFKVSAAAWIPSLTFLDPGPFNKVFSTAKFDWIDGVYWSLFVEVRFYILAGMIFFLSKERFSRMICLFGLTVCCLSLIAALGHLSILTRLLAIFFIADHLPWFLIGIGFLFMFKKTEPSLSATIIFASVVTLVARGGHDRSIPEVFSALFIPSLFFAVFRSPILNQILSLPFLTGIGSASYSLYLIHQNIGVALIGWLSVVLHLTGEISLILPILMIVAVTILARGIYKWWEIPLNRQTVAIGDRWFFHSSKEPAGDNAKARGILRDAPTTSSVLAKRAARSRAH